MGNKEKDKTYLSTLSGVVTEDTLSFEEKRELDQKKQNNTLTDEDRKRLRDDDSISSLRSTMGIFEKDREKYNPNVQYFMMDYWDKNEVRHVRSPYLTQFDLVVQHFRPKSSSEFISLLTINNPLIGEIIMEQEDRIETRDDLLGHLFSNLYQFIQYEIDNCIENLLSEYEGEDSETYEKMVREFGENIDIEFI